MNKSPLPFLRLVEPEAASEPRGGTVTGGDTYSGQSQLFSDANTQTLGFVEASQMSAETFTNLLEEVSPAYIFDVRQVPIFSAGKLNRKSAFSLFEANDIRYFDVAGFLGTRSHRDAALNPKLLIPNILQNLLSSDNGLEGPVLFFVDEEQLNEAFIQGVADTLPNLTELGWTVAVWNSADVQTDFSKREIVFVSHANPEDNEIASWFAARLSLAGYSVWSDVTKLTGGEVFWDTIEDVLRNRTARFVVLLSKKGHEKPGVLDEVNLAVSLERRYKVDGFVIPVRVDDLSFSAVRANLARKNIIDGSLDLSLALDEVVHALEAANVSKSTKPEIEQLKRAGLFQPRRQVEPEQWDLLLANSLSILNWPKAMSRFASNNEARSELNKNGLIFREGPGGHFAFATREELSDKTIGNSAIVIKGEADTSSCLNGDAGGVFRCNESDLKRTVSSLVGHAIEEQFLKKGLSRYRLANQKPCWFLTFDQIPKNTISFKDAWGTKRRRALAGFSKARNVYWHFALETKFILGDRSIRLIPHVVFSEDGKKPIQSSARQHALRRSFCKNWWNDRWRDMLGAMVSFLADGNAVWKLHFSPSQYIEVDGALRSFENDHISQDDDHVGIIEEPKVVVGSRQQTADPRKGLLLFGPIDFERNPRDIRVGVIGTRDGIGLFEEWCRAFKKAIPLTESQRTNNEIPFPGFKAVFGADWPSSEIPTIVVSRADLINSIRQDDRHQAVYSAVSMFEEGIRKAIHDDDIAVDIWYVVIPDEVHRYGRPQSRVPSEISVASSSEMNKRMAKKFSPQTPSLFDEVNKAAEVYGYNADFHHQLKSRLLQQRVVTQIFRESSIKQTISNAALADAVEPEAELADLVNESPVRQLQAASDVAWNLGTSSFFKAGGRPWKVSTARPGVCYVGLIFKRDERGDGNHSCCGAQMFLDSGEGLIFKGTPGRYYSDETKEFHLSQEQAEALLSEVLQEYERIHGIFPSEVFVHGRTRFNRDELAGFREACGEKADVTGVRITRSNQFKMYSTGDMPVKRGTFQILTSHIALLWTTGFVDALGTYQGRETPNPLRIEICGETASSMSVVLADIMTLTKMNFNSSVFSDGLPVTMRFANAIGDVLAATGTHQVPPLPFRHYI